MLVKARKMPLLKVLVIQAASDSAAQTETAGGSASAASSAPALDEEESAKIAEALNSSSGDLSPGSNAVQPGAMGAAAGA